jgi:hypothetical protein
MYVGLKDIRFFYECSECRELLVQLDAYLSGSSNVLADMLCDVSAEYTLAFAYASATVLGYGNSLLHSLLR